MKRPFLVNFIAIQTESFLAVKAAIGVRTNKLIRDEFSSVFEELPKASFPLQALRLLRANQFIIKLEVLDREHQVIFQKQVETDRFGNFSIKIPIKNNKLKVNAIQVYELGFQTGIEFYLGTFFPLSILPPKKMVICDFDKTLVDTRYSTTKELYHSLTRPISFYPTVKNSITLLRHYIKEAYHPFILSASPHFYEDAMRDWLYQNKIFTAGIFLKDYRQIFSLFETNLSPKDLKIQGLYKLNHLLDILAMTGIPDELVLFGDNFESDPIIYLALVLILEGKQEPWVIWNALKKQKAFLLNRKQNSIFLSKIFQLTSQSKSSQQKCPNIQIYIRKQHADDKLKLSPEFEKFLGSHKELIKMYLGQTEHPLSIDQLLKGESNAQH